MCDDVIRITIDRTKKIKHKEEYPKPKRIKLIKNRKKDIDLKHKNKIMEALIEEEL